jgi:hypothetical protein
MGGPVRVNGREVVTAKSGGVSFAMGDVCTVPDGGGPVPFVNVAVSADAAGGARNVRVNGVPVVLAKSTFARSSGDEPGKDGGVISGTTQGAAQFANYSYDVRIEGQPVPRAFDPMIHNLDLEGIPNAYSPAELQDAASVDPDLDILCAAICFCDAMEIKMTCLRLALATPRIQTFSLTEMDPDAPPGHKSFIRCWDPHMPPGFYVEPCYDMTPPPPRPMVTGLKSDTMKDAYGNPMPMVGGDFPIIPGSRRPDVVVPIDPTKPPGPGNIKRIFEVKFPPDVPRNGQLKAYGKIAEPTGTVTVVGPDDPCECKGRHKPKPMPKVVPVPAPKKQKKNQKDPKREEEPDSPTEPLPTLEPGTVGVMAVLLLMLQKAAEVVKGGSEPVPAFGPLPPVTPGFPGSKPPEPGEPVWPWSPPAQSQ